MGPARAWPVPTPREGRKRTRRYAPLRPPLLQRPHDRVPDLVVLWGERNGQVGVVRRDTFQARLMITDLKLREFQPTGSGNHHHALPRSNLPLCHQLEEDGEGDASGRAVEQPGAIGKRRGMRQFIFSGLLDDAVVGERADNMYRLVIAILLVLPLQSSWFHCNRLGKMTPVPGRTFVQWYTPYSGTLKLI